MAGLPIDLVDREFFVVALTHLLSDPSGTRTCEFAWPEKPGRVQISGRCNLGVGKGDRPSFPMIPFLPIQVGRSSIPNW